MHLVNTRKNQKEIMLFINDREKFQTIKNESEEVIKKKFFFFIRTLCSFRMIVISMIF